jgi:acyl-CoA synthetase (AMP-forming)/AMP-acid ligase II
MVAGDPPADLPLTIPAVVERAAARWPDAEGLVDGDRRLTFSHLATSVDDAARALVASGVGPGDRVALWGPNSGTWAIAALGVLRAGGVVVTVNTRFKGPEARQVLRDSGARLLLTVADFLGTDYVELLGGRDDLPDLGEIVALDDPAAHPTATPWSAVLARGATTDRSVTRARADAVDPDGTAAILFTSGTTGVPKGAMLTHGAAVRAYDAWSTVVGLDAGDRYLIVNPFFHCFGLLAGIVASLLKGATIIPHAVFDVPSVMRRVDEERVTMLPGAPTVYQSMLDHPDLDRFDLSSLRLAVTGAATVPVELVRRMREELTFTTVVTGYGLTEATGIATMCRHDDPIEVIATTAGRPIPGVEVRIVDDGGAVAAPGEPGEVLIRGYNLMQGYCNAEVDDVIDAEGWLHSGDIGVVDERGNLRITDRKKDMFIVGGFNAYPAEIENMMLAYPGISQVAVVGVPDERMGEVAAAFVLPRPGAEVDPADLVDWCRGRMANYKVPRQVEIVDGLPLNASGKVQKFELRDRAAAAAARRREE